MGPHHRAQLAIAVAQFLAEIRRLARAKLRNEHDRLLTTLEPSRAPPAATATSMPQPTRGRAKPPDRRAQAAVTGPSRGSMTAGRRARKASPVKPAQLGKRRPVAARPDREPATVPPRQASAPATVQGGRAKLAAAPAARATSSVTGAPAVNAAPMIAAAQTNTLPGTSAPLTATAATAISNGPGVAVAVSATEVRRPGEAAANVRDHDGEQDSARRRGTVKWFNPTKGYGFIRDDDGMDVFIHVSAVASSGLRTLVQGQAVEYEVQRSAKGLHAVSITAPGAVTLRSA